METLFTLISLTLFVLLIIGLIKPSNVLRWTKKPNRWKVFGFYLIGIFSFTIIFTPFIDDENDNTNTSDYTEPMTKEDSLALIEKRAYNDSIAAIEEKVRNEAKQKLSSFRKKYDEFEGVSFYRDKRTPYYVDVNFIYPYIVEKNDSYGLRLKLQYTDDDWLFIKKATFLIDGEKSYVNGNWKSDNESHIWEWLDINVDSEDLYILEKIANSKVTKVRYDGTQYYDDRIITWKEKDIIKKTLNIYKDLR